MRGIAIERGNSATTRQNIIEPQTAMTQMHGGNTEKDEGEMMNKKTKTFCLSLHHASFPLPEVLTDLFSAEGPDAVEAKAEDDAVFAAEANVEGVVLDGNGATVEGVAERNG